MDGALKPPQLQPPELQALEEIIAAAGSALGVTRHESAAAPGAPSLPVYAITLGTDDPAAPAAGFFAGVHGLERIGTQVILSFLRSIVARLAWDDTLKRQLEAMRLVFMPLVNPGGMLRGTRANPAGVDLMRNSPVDASDPVPFLVGGQRISPGLPWYRGSAGEPMQPESRALCDTVERELLARPFSIALDCHSGFGMRDRLWFPFACRRAPFPGLAALHAMHGIFEDAHNQHVYVIEPQSRQYLAHGDLWDHLVLRADPSREFLPLTLEMGSWLWVKKNPRQFFSLRGLFNPLVEHREQRVLRRHWPLLDFVVRAAMSASRWLPATTEEREKHRKLALARWYLPMAGR
jgi:hypothetical protein